MRMWCVNPKLMCRKHLLGEHVEMHMFRGCVLKGRSLDGYLKKNLVEIGGIKKRHDVLAEEIQRRGYKHKSPLDEVPYNKYWFTMVDIQKSLKELKRRCPECRKGMCK